MASKFTFLVAVLLAVSLPHAGAARPRLPAEVFQTLDAPMQVSLYSLHPDPRAVHWWFSRWYHGYRILGQVAVPDPAQRRKVAASVEKTARTYSGDTKCIFSPRHGVRVSSASETYDFLICFQCWQMEVYSGERRIAEFSATGSPDVLNRILRSVHIRIAK